MSNWRDVMEARGEADAALSNADTYGGMIEDGREDRGLAVLLSSRAVCLEIRALATLIDFARGDAR